jgi:hypothetical protein
MSGVHGIPLNYELAYIERLSRWYCSQHPHHAIIVKRIVPFLRRWNRNQSRAGQPIRRDRACKGLSDFADRSLLMLPLWSTSAINRFLEIKHNLICGAKAISFTGCILTEEKTSVPIAEVVMV